MLATGIESWSGGGKRRRGAQAGALQPCPQVSRKYRCGEETCALRLSAAAGGTDQGDNRVPFASGSARPTPISRTNIPGGMHGVSSPVVPAMGDREEAEECLAGCSSAHRSVGSTAGAWEESEGGWGEGG